MQHAAAIALQPIALAATPRRAPRSILQVLRSWFDDEADDVRDQYLGQSANHHEFALRTRDWAEFERRTARLYSHGAW